MKKLFSLFVVLLATTALWAHDFEVDGIYYNWYFDGGDYLEVTYCGSKSDSYSNEYSGSVEIPAIIYDDYGTAYNVIRIHAWAFSDCSSLTSITIPNSVTSIGDHAFDGCSSLTSVTIPNSVTSIANRCFQDCSSLTSITIPNSVTSIEDRAFYRCSSLTSITIPNSVTSIGGGAFKSCSSLTSIVVKSGNTAYDSRENCNAIIETATNTLIVGCKNTIIPNSVTSIGDGAFADSSLSSITIPNSVTSIGNGAFAGSSLSSITIPNSVTNIGRGAFQNCSSLSSVTIPNSVTSIGDDVFASCPSLSSITIPNSVTSIGDYAFWNCINLSSVAIPNSVTSIGVRAFRHCFYLTDLTIGSGVTSIGEEAFIYCSNLKKIYCYQTTPPSVANNTFDHYNATLYVPCDSKEAYEEHPVFGKFENIEGLDDCNGGFVTTHIHDTICQGEVYEFGEHLCDTAGTYTAIIGDVTTFLYLTVLPSPTVTITVEANDSYIWHDEVYTESGEYKYVTVAANGCDSTEVLLLTIISSEENEPNSSNKIYYTSSDGNIVTPNATDVFGANIISNTYENGQGVITFDGPVTMIGDSAFCNCKSLTSITIPNSVKHFGFMAFAWCSNTLKKTNFIGDIADWCDITFGEFYANPIELSSNFYINDQEVTELVIPNTVDSIHANAFRWCRSFRTITIPSSVTFIGKGAFEYSSNVQSIFIPKSVKCIQQEAFAGGVNLQSIIVEEGNPVYDSRDNCNAIIETDSNTLIAGCSITNIPKSVTHIGAYAFSYQNLLASIKVPTGIISIGDYAYYSCLFANSVYIPKSVQSIGHWAFKGCYSLNSIEVEEGNTIYDSRNNCNAIIETATNSLIVACQNTIIPEGVTNIGKDAFSNCSHSYYSKPLTSIVLPSSITNIEYRAFFDCSSLDTIHCYATTPPTINQYSFGNYDATLYVPCQSLEAYKSHEVWGQFNTIQCLPDTPERVLSCEEAVALCLETGATATTEEYTIRGYVTEITNEYSEQYKNISFYMADTKEGGQVLFTYRIKPMYEADIAVKVGDFVEVVGTLVNYNGYLPEVYPGVYTIVNEPGFPTGTSDILSPTSNTQKLVKDGQLLIIHDGKTYTIMGAEIK